MVLSKLLRILPELVVRVFTIKQREATLPLQRFLDIRNPAVRTRQEPTPFPGLSKEVIHSLCLLSPTMSKASTALLQLQKPTSHFKQPPKA